METTELNMSALMCPICFTNFTSSNQDLNPMVSACGHSICYACANKLAKKECPSCKKVLDVAKLVKNYSLLEVIDNLNSDEANKRKMLNVADVVKNLEACDADDDDLDVNCSASSMHDCTRCDTKTTTPFCRRCNDYHCDECRQRIHSGYHKQGADSPKCKIHTQAELEYVCVSCDGKLICRFCLSKSHKRHQFELLSVVADSEHAKALVRLQELQIGHTIAKSVVDAAKGYSDELENSNGRVIKEIEDYFVLLHSALDKRKSVLFAELDSTISKQRSKFETSTDQLREFISLPIFGDDDADTVRKKLKLSAIVAEADVMVSHLNFDVFRENKVVFEKSPDSVIKIGKVVVINAPSSSSSHYAAALANVIKGGTRVLIPGGEHGNASTSTLVYDVTANSFQKGPEMKIARMEHASTTLSDGQVFICGGYNGKDILSSCESFDAKTNTFTEIGNMNEKRSVHAAVTLPDNRGVFIVGGNDGIKYLQSAETFDPITKKFTTCKGRMTTARWSHTANLLSNERVLVCGGSNNSTLQSTEFYDIETDSFSTGPDLTVERCAHASTTLLDGRILITGGEYGIGSTSTEFYDPKTNSFIVGPQMLMARRSHSSSLLGDGRVLIIGGKYNAKTTTEIYDPKTNSFTKGPNLPSGRYWHSSSSF